MLRIYKGISMADRFLRDKVYDIMEIRDNICGVEVCVPDEMNRVRTLYYKSMADCKKQWRQPE